MDKCEIHPHCYVSPLTPCPGCVSQAALDKVRLEPQIAGPLQSLPDCKGVSYEEWIQAARKLHREYGDLTGYQIWIAWCELDPDRFNDNVANSVWASTASPVVAPRKMTMTEERMMRINSARLDEIHDLEDRLTSSEVWRRIYAVAAVAGWACLILYSAFGGPEL